MSVIVWPEDISLTPATRESIAAVERAGCAIFHLNTEPQISLIVEGPIGERMARAEILARTFKRRAGA